MSTSLVVKLLRTPSTLDGVFGVFLLPDGSRFISGELPDNNNRSQISCIPEGRYLCKYTFSRRLGWTYEVLNVPNRQGIRIHAANYCGLRKDGKRQELLGCIALGSGTGAVNGQKILTNSRVAIASMVSKLGKQEFILEVNYVGTT